MKLDLGAVADFPDDHCVAVGDGRAVVVRIGDELRAFRNLCLHQQAPIAGGWVRDGVLSCPLHFWRYDVDDGKLTAGNGALESFPVEVVDGRASVDLPDPPPRRRLREQLLQRAAGYDRDAAFQARSQQNQ